MWNTTGYCREIMLFPLRPCVPQPYPSGGNQTNFVKVRLLWPSKSNKIKLHLWKGLELLFKEKFPKILSRYREWQAHAGFKVQLVCCDNDFFVPRRSVKQMQHSCMKKKKSTYSVCSEGRRDVLWLDVSRALLHEGLLEAAAAGKIINWISFVFLQNLVLKTELLICFLFMNFLNAWIILFVAWEQQNQAAQRS